MENITLKKNRPPPEKLKILKAHFHGVGEPEKTIDSNDLIGERKY